MQPFNLQLLGGLGVLARSCPVAAATATGPCQCHLPMIPAITGMASVLQQSKFILIMHAFSIKIYKMDSDLSTAITKVKVFWPFKVKKRFHLILLCWFLLQTSILIWMPYSFWLQITLLLPYLTAKWDSPVISDCRQFELKTSLSITYCFNSWLIRATGILWRALSEERLNH